MSGAAQQLETGEVSPEIRDAGRLQLVAALGERNRKGGARSEP